MSPHTSPTRLRRMAFTVSTLAVAGLTLTGHAAAAPTTGIDISPVGYNIVDGVQDLDNPITDDDITADQGLSATQSSTGSVLSPRSVIDDDDRTQIEDTTTSAHRRVGHVSYTNGNSYSTCTGWLISSDTVVTAGHCTPDGAANMRFSAGRNGDETPYGTQNVTQIWRDAQSGGGHDWAALKLDEPVGDTVGWFGITSTDGENLVGDAARIIGYPGDKPSATMWQHTGTTSDYSDREVFYDTDTYGGQSGAAVTDRQADTAYAIHVEGRDGFNAGTRISAELFNTLVAVSER